MKFTKSGSVRFTTPDKMGPGTVNGEIGYWVRARIVKGNYGKEAEYRQRTDEKGVPLKDQQGNYMYELVQATFGPPSVASLKLGYTHQPSGPLTACQAYNDFTYTHLTDKASGADGSAFTPFTPTADTRPTLYLGFDRPFANRSIMLYAQVEPPLYREIAEGTSGHPAADQDTLESVKEQGPRTLRHRGRAVTAQDFEDLAFEASPDVARARAIATKNGSDAGRVGLIIVPRSTAPKPIPSLNLIDNVKEYLLARCAPTLDLWLAGPNWVQVKVTAEVVPSSLEAADTLEATVVTALQRFLHPLTGGSDGQGWAFGPRPHKSDLYVLIESIDGVDHVHHLSVEEDPKIQTLPPDPLDRFMVFSGTHDISLISPEGGA